MLMELKGEQLASVAGSSAADAALARAGLQAAQDAMAACNSGVLILAAAPSSYPIMYANPALCRISGYRLEELIGQGCAVLKNEDGQPGLEQLVRKALEQRCQLRDELRSYRKDGSIYWNALTLSPGSGASPAHVVCNIDDISELHQQRAELAHLANHDALTGLPNRNLYSEHLQRAISAAAGRMNPAAVLCLSVDNYNLVNESLGHVAGDQFLVGVAQRLRGCLRERDTLSRHGGNEFVLILGELGSARDAAQTCEQIYRNLAAPLPVCGQDLHAACSIGIARYPQDSGDGGTLLRYADMALSHARARGGYRYEFFASALNQRSAERIQMEAALRVALAQNQLELMYQPMADLRDGAVCALEALVRWQHPKLGQMNAAAFISIAEDAGLMPEIGYWTLRRVCQHMGDWREAGLPPVRVGVNISPKQFRDASLPERVARILEEYAIAPEQLSLEITEAALLQDTITSSQALSLLKDLGIGLTLDDFGTGYSSLNHLKQLPFDLVKIDCALIGNVATGTDDAALVNTIISMAHQLGIKVSAEGVETEAQCDFLRRNMCDQIQGFFLGAPQSMTETGALLAQRQALPPHLLRIQKQKRTLLLVDDEPNIVAALKRLLRRDDYQILTASGGQEGLDLLATTAVDVIVSDQRMPGMIGADFLRAAKGLYPDTIRIMLSGYTELQSVTDAVNEGAIYKFLTKPWDDEQLRGHIAEAFRMKEIADDNERLNLELRTANYELASTNRRMEDLLRQNQQQIRRDEISLSVARELLQFLPLPVLGLDDEGLVAFVNAAADDLFGKRGALLGNEAIIMLPALFPYGLTFSGSHEAEIGGHRYAVVAHPMGADSSSRGSLITLSRCEKQG
jgi:diguanylate cyclase (GGDEF)-like protein/PAS domain S-box-containing protein